MSRPIVKIISLVVVLVLAGAGGWFYYAKIANKEIKLAVVLGKKTGIFYRAYLGKYFETEKIKVGVYAKNKKGELSLVGGNFNFGGMTGGDVLKEVVDKRVDGGLTWGESLILAASRDFPVVAVAGSCQGRDQSRKIVLRSDIKINSSSEMKGLTFLSQAGGLEEAIYLKEFLKKEGLDPSVDVKIIEQVPLDESVDWLKEKKVDGGIFRSMDAENIVRDGAGYIYNALDWVDARLFSPVLIFHKDFVKNHADDVKKIVAAYGKRIQFERGKPDDQKRLSEAGAELVIGDWVERGNMFECEYPPIVNTEALDKTKDLLMKYDLDLSGRSLELENYIDNSFVEGLR